MQIVSTSGKASGAPSLATSYEGMPESLAPLGVFATQEQPALPCLATGAGSGREAASDLPAPWAASARVSALYPIHM